MNNLYKIIFLTLLANCHLVQAEEPGIDYGASLGLYQVIRHSHEEIGSGPMFVGRLYIEFRDDSILDKWRVEYIHKSYLENGAPFDESGLESTFDGIGISREFRW